MFVLAKKCFVLVSSTRFYFIFLFYVYTYNFFIMILVFFINFILILIYNLIINSYFFHFVQIQGKYKVRKERKLREEKKE